ncbi:GMC family oxidoreductase [Marinobacteraceae bacterium S3BR75-40.1]
MATQKIYENGLASGWKVTDAATLSADQTVEADVVVIGTGAGGGTTAEILAKAGLKVVMVEEGRLYYQNDFKMDELWSYSRLYQEGMSRITADGSIAILQGRCVGGSTTVNWTSSFRTPDETLDYWQQRFGVKASTKDDLAGWFAGREERLSIHPWQVNPNANNAALRDGCERLGWDWKVIPRNVKGCWDLGYCGFGCPTNAKQGSLTTTVPGTLERGGELYHCLRADRLLIKGDRVEGLEASALDKDALAPTGVKVQLRARHYVVAASALGTPALLLRSEAPDPYGRVGKRTFLHPVNATVAEMPERVDPYYGAPQSIYSDEFVWKNGVEGEAGFKLEVPPMHPAMASGVMPFHGKTQHKEVGNLPYLQSVLALIRDGFHPDSPGGEVSLSDEGQPVLDYPVTDYLWRGLREAYMRMAEVQFAAGAKRVRLIHMDSKEYLRWPEAKQAIKEIPMELHRVRLFTAHQMGGAGMGEDPRESVVNSFGEHHQLSNLSIHDASIFPTSIGANPQLSVYGLSARNSARLAARLKA